MTEDLRTALTATRRVVAGITGGQWSLPTPCPDWTVDQLAVHLILGNQFLAARLRGEPAPMASADPDPSLVDSDRLAAYDDAGGQLMAAFGADGALETMVAVPFGTVPGAVALHLRLTELLVHGWDLARATGQRIEVPAELAGQELAFSRQALSPVATRSFAVRAAAARQPRRVPARPARGTARAQPLIKQRVVGFPGHQVAGRQRHQALADPAVRARMRAQPRESPPWPPPAV